MSYKNDHLLVIVNKYGKASGDAKAELYETYDNLRDLTVSGPGLGGSGLGATGNFILNFARMFAPASFTPILGSSSINIPGTSYSSSVINGGNSITPGGQASFGFNNLGNYPGFPTGGAVPLALSFGLAGLPLLSGIGNMYNPLGNDFAIGGMPTGAAASLAGASQLASAAGSAGGVAAGFGKGQSFVIPAAGLVAGIGGLVSTLAPYFGPFGLAAGMSANFANGIAGSVLNAYQSVNSRIINNADRILTEKIKNIETVCKQLDTQSDILRKMLKESTDGDSKALQNL